MKSNSANKGIMSHSSRGFTLIELLVVISIIGILSSVVLASLNSARALARDAVRKNDLAQIRTALLLYKDRHGNFIQNGSGCGYVGNGSGWFNYSGGSYPASIASCLVDAGLLTQEIIDPTGGRTSSAGSGNTYMKYHCVQNGEWVAYIFAKLESEPQDSTATDGKCCSTCDSSYGMNYAVKVEY